MKRKELSIRLGEIAGEVSAEYPGASVVLYALSGAILSRTEVLMAKYASAYIETFNNTIEEQCVGKIN